MPKRQFIPWFKSLFTKKLVKTGEGFTVNDNSLPDTVRLKDSSTPDRTSCSHCTTRTNVHFLLVGFSHSEGKVKYRLYHDQTRRVFDIDESLFNFIFRFTRNHRDVRTLGRK